MLVHPAAPFRLVDASLPLREAIAPTRFDVSHLPPTEQLLAWRERVGQVVDVVVSRARTQMPFSAWINRYMMGEYLFIDCYSDQVTLDRSIARISRDSARSIAFHLFLDGEPAAIFRHGANRNPVPADLVISAVDLDQPFQMARKHSAHAEIFMPAARLQSVFPDPGMLHGRGLMPNAPGVSLIIERVKALIRDIRHLLPSEAQARLEAIVELIIHAFGKSMGIRDSAQALTRELTISNARRIVREHLFDSELTPERVLASLGQSRASVYRLFEHEGGLAAYIRNLRLRAAATDLVRLPELAVKDIAYSVGFKSASDFSRAFRRAYETTPQALRDYDAWYLADAADVVRQSTESAAASYFETKRPSGQRVGITPLPGLALPRRG
jgi:AraC-like DNA-binding protein